VIMIEPVPALRRFLHPLAEQLLQLLRAQQLAASDLVHPAVVVSVVEDQRVHELVALLGREEFQQGRGQQEKVAEALVLVEQLPQQLRVVQRDRREGLRMLDDPAADGGETDLQAPLLPGLIVLSCQGRAQVCLGQLAVVGQLVQVVRVVVVVVVVAHDRLRSVQVVARRELNPIATL